MTKNWPVGHEWKRCVQLLGRVLQESGHTSLFPILSPVGWNAALMAGASTAFLDNEVTLGNGSHA